jgi:antitoxin component YwqK of YwqJK toxin-antitoxin module
MKANRLPYSIVLLLLTAACNSPNCREDVVCETYVHRYGVPLDPQDWSARGQHGQVMTTMKDGVVVTKNYDSGTLHGEATYTFPHQEIIQKREAYNQGQLEQEIWNYPNGVPMQQMTHHSSSNRSNVIWYENGVPHCKEEYENGNLIQGEYFNLSNQLESRVEDQNGIRTRRNAYGQFLSLDEIQNGKMVLRTTCHVNGAPESITPYRNGVAEGQRRTFLPTGEPDTIEEWRNDRQHGNTIVFQNGEKYADVSYRNGIKHGLERRYREGNNLVEEVNWVQDQKHGPCYSYVGDSKKTTWYVQDKPVNKATYDAFERQQ